MTNRSEIILLDKIRCDMLIQNVSSRNEIYKVLTQCSEDFFNQNYNNEKAISNLSDKFFKNGVVKVVLINKQLAGFVAYYCNDTVTKTAFLSMIIVKNDFQHCGVGTELLNCVVSDCKKNNFDFIRCEIDNKNNNSKSFFKKQKFNFEKNTESETSYYIRSLKE